MPSDRIYAGGAGEGRVGDKPERKETSGRWGREHSWGLNKVLVPLELVTKGGEISKEV